MKHERNPSRAGALAAGMVACFVLGTAGRAADIAPPVSVSNAWIRWLPADLPAAGYATLRNVSDARLRRHHVPCEPQSTRCGTDGTGR
jgi:hypothetical protein